MSEYQYYEFRTIDRSLSRKEMSELRALSTRAQITPTSFVNFYNFGDFRGEPEVLMEKYFDAFLYFANWGTRRLMLRLPRRLVDIERTALYCHAEHASLHVKGDWVILEFSYYTEDSPDDEEEVETEAVLSAVTSLREDLLAGDLRALYLGWLLCAELADFEDGDDVEAEPPVPAGLAELTGPLKSFAEFLQIDRDLIAVAAERSPALVDSQPSHDEWAAWIHGLPGSEKEVLLLRVVEGQSPYLRAELLQRLRQDSACAMGGPEAGSSERRTAGALLAEGERRAEERERREADRRAAEEARRRREEAAARVAYLDSLRGQEPELWRRVEALIETKKPKDYDQAVIFLVDLRDLAARTGREDEFETRIRSLRGRHALKPSLQQRLDRAGVGTAPR